MLVPLLATALAASAGPLHAGLPEDALGPDLPAPRYQSARLGTTRDVPKGLVRVYVGPTEAAAEEWFTEMAALMKRHKPDPVPDLADQAVAAGDGMVLVRDANVGLLVEAASGARAWVDQARGALVPGPLPWPDPPTLAPTPGGGWTAQAPDARHLAWVGGALHPSAAAPGAPLAFSRPPRRLVAWDGLGRAAVQDFDARGQPVETPPLRPSPDAPSPGDTP